MQMTIVDFDTLGQTIAESKILTTFDEGHSLVHVAEREGIDIFIVQTSVNGSGFVIEGDSVDREHGGSVHDHARAELAAAKG